MARDRTMTDPGPPEDSEPEAEQPTLWVLYHADPRLLGLRRVLENGAAIEIGRDGAEVIPGLLDDPLLSARHARIERRGAVVTITDLGSRNGTTVNGVRADSARLTADDVIGLGDVLLLYRSSPVVIPEANDSALGGVGHRVAEVRQQIELVAPRDTTVLIQGEPGVGKDVVASEIHRRSRARGKYVAVDCAGLADGVLQSELFGHAAGAYSGAVGARTGLVEEAAHGTLFLDEIGDASVALQASLLRLLQNREYRPLGSDKPRPASARVVVATHRDLSALAANGGFRADLLSRLQRWTLNVPPLRERLEDLGVLAQRFAQRFAGPRARVGRSLARALAGHRWPGNVRELEAVIERAAIAAAGATTLELPSWLDGELRAGGTRDHAHAVTTTAPRVRPATTRPPASELQAALEAHRGNIRALAATLGVGRTTLYRWLSSDGIAPRRAR